MEQAVNLDQQYLEAILDWLNVNLEGFVSRWQLAGQKPEDRFRGLYVSDGDALSAARQGVASHWGTAISLPAEKEAELAQGLNRAMDRIHAIESQAKESGNMPGLLSLAGAFGLNEFEWWAFIVCLAPALDLRYEKIYGYLQDDVTAVQARVDLILMLLCPEDLTRLYQIHFFNEKDSLRKYKLIFPVEDVTHKSPNMLRQAFSVAPAVLEYLLGQYTPGHLGSGAALVEVDGDTDSDEALAVFELENVPSREIIEQVAPIFSLYGVDTLQQELLVRRLSSVLDRPLLKVVLEKGTTVEAALDRLQLAVRDGYMLNALLYVDGVDVLMDRDGCLLPDAFQVVTQQKESIF